MAADEHEASEIDLADSVEVDPEEIKFARLELPADEDDRDESPERALCLVESEAPPSSEREPVVEEATEPAAETPVAETQQEEEK